MMKLFVRHEACAGGEFPHPTTCISKNEACVAGRSPLRLGASLIPHHLFLASRTSAAPQLTSQVVCIYNETFCSSYTVLHHPHLMPVVS